MKSPPGLLSTWDHIQQGFPLCLFDMKTPRTIRAVENSLSKKKFSLLLGWAGFIPVGQVSRPTNRDIRFVHTHTHTCPCALCLRAWQVNKTRDNSFAFIFIESLFFSLPPYIMIQFYMYPIRLLFWADALSQVVTCVVFQSAVWNFQFWTKHQSSSSSIPPSLPLSLYLFEVCKLSYKGPPLFPKTFCYAPLYYYNIQNHN